jgi:uncharacterized membrane protein YqjE
MEARSTPGANGTGPRSDESIAELMKRLSEQTTELVRKEIELGRAELQEKGKKAGIGAGMFGGAGLFGFYAFGALTATFVLALDTAVDSWLAALIVTAVYGAVAGVLALTGKNKVQQAGPPVPERAIGEAKQDVQVAKDRAKAGRN